MPFLALITGPLGKWLAVAAAVGAAGLGFMLWLHAHDAAVQAAMTDAADKVAADAATAQAARNTAAVEADAAASIARAAGQATALEDITHAPDANTPDDSDAIGRALDRLRNTAPTGPN